MLYGNTLLIQQSQAKLQTTPYIAIRSEPQYSNATAMPYANIHAPKGGILSMSGTGSFDNLNSDNGKGTAASGSGYVFDTLMTGSFDESAVLYPLLAEKVTFDPERPKFIIFHLNPKAHFSNGQPVTAEDVKFTFDIYKYKAKPGIQSYLTDLKKVEVLSKYQVKMEFSDDRNIEMPLIIADMPIYSKKDWESREFTKVTLQPIIGSGPYVVDKIDAGRSIIYKRNPNYWAKDLPINRGRYNFDRIKYVYYRNPESAFEGFKSGQYFFRQESSARTWVNDYRFPAVKAGIVKKYIFQRQYPIAAATFVLNTRKPPLNDIRFRQAIQYAYDFEWQNKAIMYGQYHRLQSYFANSDLEARGKPSAEELKIINPLLSKLSSIEKLAVLNEWKAPVSDGSGFNRENLIEAKKLLNKAGYFVKNGQLTDPKGRAVKLEYLIRQEGNNANSILSFIRNLKKLGININIRPVDGPQYIERVRRFDFDFLSATLPQSLNPGNEQMFFWGSQAADQQGNYNYAGVKNSAIDQVIQSLINAKNRQELTTRTHVLDRLLRSGYYHVLTFGTGESWLSYWDIYGQPKIRPKLTVGLEYWWVDPEKSKKVAQYLNQNNK
nr:extracellular solute-binding protein [Acinetobacter sp. Marseille-Q1620]